MNSPVRIEAAGGRIEIHSAWRDKDLIRQIPGARWSKESSTWSAPLSWVSCKVSRSLFGPRLEIGPCLVGWARRELESRIDPALSLRQALTPRLGLPLDPRLYPFQAAGAEFLITARRAILGEPLGSGKTLMALAAARHLDARPALVVCPSTMRIPWAREAALWWPETPVYVISGSKARREKLLRHSAREPGLVILNWELLRRHSRLAGYGSMALPAQDDGPLNLIPWQLIIADEAHRMKDARSQQTRALWATTHANPRPDGVPYRWALTGTPLTNAPDTLWPILHFLDPTEWPARTTYIDRWCRASLNVWGGLDVTGIRPEHKAEFEAVFHPRFRRLPKEVVLPQLPPIQRIRKYVQMGAKQEKAYRDMAARLMAETEDGRLVVAKNPLSQLTRLVQFSSSCAEIDGETVRLTEPSCKLDELMADLDDYLADEEGIVVFAQSRQLINMASERLSQAKPPIAHSLVEGGQTPDQRQNAIDAFEEGKVPVILVVIAAGGVGITLVRGRIGIFLQRSYSLVDMQQAQGRIHRIGSERHSSILIVDYIAQGTIEETQLDILEGKHIRLEEITGDRDTMARILKGERLDEPTPEQVRALVDAGPWAAGWGHGAVVVDTPPRGWVCEHCGRAQTRKARGRHIYLFGPPRCTPCAAAWAERQTR